jgi:DNA-binding response OmpR family regulator
LRVAIVEDEALLAMELESILADAGHLVAGHATDSRGALELISTAKPDLVLLDIHLHDGPTGVSVAEELQRADAPAVVFLTANISRVPEDFAGALGVIAKPYSIAGVEAALAYLERALADGTVTDDVPHSLTLAPRLESERRRVRA